MAGPSKEQREVTSSVVVCLESWDDDSSAAARELASVDVPSVTLNLGDAIRAPVEVRTLSGARAGPLARRNRALAGVGDGPIAFVRYGAVDGLPLAWPAFERWIARRCPLACVAVEPRRPDPMETKWGALLRETSDPRACVLWSASHLRSIGGYDERFDEHGSPLWFGEIDAQRRAHRAGMLVGSVGVPHLAFPDAPQDVGASALLEEKTLGWSALPFLLAREWPLSLSRAPAVIRAIRSARRQR
jgi:hypothetical protein